jgi:hypothetical protein
MALQQVLLAGQPMAPGQERRLLPGIDVSGSTPYAMPTTTSCWRTGSSWRQGHGQTAVVTNPLEIGERFLIKRIAALPEISCPGRRGMPT